MPPRALIEGTSILSVWTALGGEPLRHGRGRAWWRNGADFNVSLNEDKNVFFDFATGTGGGVLMLIETALGCNRRDAVQWLAAHHNITLDDQRPLTAAERRDYAIRRAAAERKARELTEWRRDRLQQLRNERNRLYRKENGASAIARTLLATDCEDEAAWAAIWDRAFDDLRADKIQRKIERIESKTPGDLYGEMRVAA